MSIGRVVRWVALGVIVVPVCLIILLVVGGYTYDRFVPSDSVEVPVEGTGATLVLRLYATSPIGKAEYDRELIIKSSGELLKQSMMSDWGGASRTSLYLTPEKNIVILGPAHDDYLITFNPLKATTRFRLPSGQWTYLGAFARDPKSRLFVLRFFGAEEQSECIPTLGGDLGGPHRSSAYRDRCY